MLPSSGAIAAREMQITRRKRKSDKMTEVYEKKDCSSEVNFLLVIKGGDRQAKKMVEKKRKEKKGGKEKTRKKHSNYKQ